MTKQNGRRALRGSLCDSSIWLALSIYSHAHHPLVRTWFDSLLESDSAVFCRATQQSYLRLMTTASVLATYSLPPMSNASAWASFDALTEDFRVAYQETEPQDVASHWRRLTQQATPSPKLWMDAYLAAFAIAGGLELVTLDQGFQQFEGLAVRVLS